MLIRRSGKRLVAYTVWEMVKYNTHFQINLSLPYCMQPEASDSVAYNYIVLFVEVISPCKSMGDLFIYLTYIDTNACKYKQIYACPLWVIKNSHTTYLILWDRVKFLPKTKEVRIWCHIPAYYSKPRKGLIKHEPPRWCYFKVVSQGISFPMN